MDDTETVVDQYLRHSGYTDVVYEPDGNVPPDFLVNGRIAVEARRLNQHEETGDSVRGLETTQFPLLERIQGLLPTLGRPNRGVSWFLSYRYYRPVESWATLKPRLVQWLTAFRDGTQEGGVEQQFGPRFSASLFRASDPLENLFVLGGYSDWDAGGWLLSEVHRNLEICVAEKTRKIEMRRARYPVWWLVLVDRIGYALSDFERERFRETYTVEHTWDRVTLVSPLDHTRWFDV